MKKERDAGVYLEDILESIGLIEKYVTESGKKGFHDNLQVQDAVIRRLEIIGEAVKNLPQDFKLKHPQIPWKEIAGMRDVLIHEYFVLDVERVWNTVENDFPQFKMQIKQLLNDLN